MIDFFILFIFCNIQMIMLIFSNIFLEIENFEYSKDLHIFHSREFNTFVTQSNK